ncbi:MAG: hypothetical protein JSS29_19385 [Proteobacteria bacterium]|nr:hypothetical protein [Pseudomonadota bacterium]
MLAISATAMGGDQKPFDLDAKDRRYPVVNPSPQQSVQISGAISNSLIVRMYAQYLTDGSPECSRQMAWGGPRYPLAITIPLSLNHQETHYETHFDVDHFLPGACRWHLVDVSAEVERDNDVSIANPFITLVGASGWTPELQGSLPEFRESSKANSENTPVNWGCDFAMIEGGPPRSRSACLGGTRNQPRKRVHLLRPGDRFVKADFTDLPSSAQR